MQQRSAHTVYSGAHVEHSRERARVPSAAAGGGAHGKRVECAGHEAGRVQTGGVRALLQRDARRGAVEHHCVVGDQPVRCGGRSPTQLHPCLACARCGQSCRCTRGCTRSIQSKRFVKRQLLNLKSIMNYLIDL